MSAFGVIPSEPPRRRALSECAPAFILAVDALIVDLEMLGYPPLVYEALRTPERQAWLYGFGRDYDDGRGKVTGAATAWNGWHVFGLAADIIHRDRLWNAPSFFRELRRLLPSHGLDFCVQSDWPHVQWGKCRKRPSAKAKQLYDAGGIEAVWAEVGATSALVRVTPSDAMKQNRQPQPEGER